MQLQQVLRAELKHKNNDSQTQTIKRKESESTVMSF